MTIYGPKSRKMILQELANGVSLPDIVAKWKVPAHVVKRWAEVRNAPLMAIASKPAVASERQKRLQQAAAELFFKPASSSSATSPIELPKAKSIAPDGGRVLEDVSAQEDFTVGPQVDQSTLPARERVALLASEKADRRRKAPGGRKPVARPSRAPLRPVDLRPAKEVMPFLLETQEVAPTLLAVPVEEPKILPVVSAPATEPVVSNPAMGKKAKSRVERARRRGAVVVFGAAWTAPMKSRMAERIMDRKAARISYLRK